MSPSSAIHAAPAVDQQYVLALLLLGDRYILQLRDNIPTIAAPGLWGLFGGRIESGERPEDALIREIEEELSIRLLEYRPWGTVDAHSEFTNCLARYWIFESDVEYCWSHHELKEGQAARDFSFDELDALSVHQLIRQVIELHHQTRTQTNNYLG
jgi:8-oxo-dGTP pyrophosphatase MutT (NUDIX family)